MTDRALNEKTAVEALIAVIEQYARDHTPPLGSMPEGIRLEIHPNIRYMIFRNLPERFRYSFTDDTLPFPPEIPVRISMELPKYAWRLVIIAEDVINGGLMPRPEFPLKQED